MHKKKPSLEEVLAEFDYCARCGKNVVFHTSFCDECEEKAHQETLDSCGDTYGSGSDA